MYYNIAGIANTLDGLYRMSRRKKFGRECPGKCSAANPNIREALDTEIPPQVRAHIATETVYKCTYCSTYWIEPFDAQSFRVRQKIIGYHELAPNRAGDYWLMADGQFRKLY